MSAPPVVSNSSPLIALDQIGHLDLLPQLFGEILAPPAVVRETTPALMRSVKLNLRTVELDCWDYFDNKNPPVLHRKETFLPKDHPLYSKFARLTQQEEKHGLLDETATIGTRNGWNARLQERGFTLRGHRLVRQRPGGQPTGLP